MIFPLTFIPLFIYLVFLISRIKRIKTKYYKNILIALNIIVFPSLFIVLTTTNELLKSIVGFSSLIICSVILVHSVFRLISEPTKK